MTLRHALAVEMAIFFALNSAEARPAVLGVVVEANRGYVNTGAVSAGATVYDGDHFSTEAGGLLRLRGDATVLDLAGDSALTVRGSTNSSQGIEAELSKGTLVFSVARYAALEIAAGGARIRPLADARTVAQVSVTGPKELCIYSRRGSLQFWYRGEMETIAEGAAYRVILDPPEDDPKNKQSIRRKGKQKAFLLLAIVAAAAGASLITHEMHHHKPVESPDRP